MIPLVLSVVLAGGVVRRVPVAPDDVVAAHARDLVGAVVAEQLVVGGASDLVVAGRVAGLPEHAGDLGPAVKRRSRQRSLPSGAARAYVAAVVIPGAAGLVRLIMAKLERKMQASSHQGGRKP